MGIKCPKCHFDNSDDTVYCGKCATPLPSLEKIPASQTRTLHAPISELTRGTIFADRYEFMEELGKGGMGKVYKVFDTRIKEEVALKILKPEISDDEKTIERFTNELKFSRKIVHKNVCRLYDLGEEEGTHYITMEYVEGQDLKSLVRQTGQLAIPTTISIAKQVCEGLSEAHKLGTVHRDLKPSNIMIDKEGNARIMDFGIARSLKAKGITGVGVMIGTPEYMSPEQVEGKDVDQRSDIYSLGVILYEMVTGRIPFEGETPLGIAMKHKSEMPKDPSEINTQIPDDLSKVILRCMEKNKEKRYQSAGEMRSELERIEKGISTTERIIPKRKPITSREITVQFSMKKLFIPALVVIAITIIAVIIWQILSQKQIASLEPAKPSIAVLPFVDLSSQKDQEYFCDGLADELINRLTKIESLMVPARTSAFSFKGKELDIQEIGKKLNVDMVLEGSLRKAGNKLRITVQLVNVADGYPVWSEKYERDEKDIFVLQDEISLAIVDKLRLKLLGEEKGKIVKRYTENVEAYQAYLKGRYHWNRRTEESLRKGLEYFSLAIEKDPNYALAYVGLAESFNIMGENFVIPPKEAFPAAKQAALKALQINKNLGEAYTSLAIVKVDFDWDWTGAEREYRRAIDLNPNYATTHQLYAEYLSMMKRHDEAIEEIKQALELDPLSLVINTVKGVVFYYKRQYDQAIKDLNNTLEIDPNFSLARLFLARCYIQKEKFDEAIAELQRAIAVSEGGMQYLGELGVAYGAASKTDKAWKVLGDLMNLSKQKYVPPFYIAAIYLALGEKEQGFKWLEAAYDERDYNLCWLKVEPLVDSVRSDSRFKELLKKVGLDNIR